MKAKEWPDQVYETLKGAGVRQVGYVPDAGHARLIRRCIDDSAMADVVLTTEEEGVALAVGAALGGQRAAVLMQSSGVGNCVNMFSIVRGFGVPCLLFVTMRGEPGEFNSWQVPMGEVTEQVLALCGFQIVRINASADVSTMVGAACDLAFHNNAMVAVVLSQQLIGHKQWLPE